MTPYEFITSLKAISSTNAKLGFFDLNKDPLIERVFHMALSSEYTFGIKKIPLYTVRPEAEQVMTLDMALELIEKQFCTNKVTGNDRIDVLRQTLEMMHPEDAEVLKMVISKKLDCGVSVTNANKVMDNPIPTFDVLLCAKQDQKLIDGLNWPEVVAQTKMDGMRVIVSCDNNGNVRYRTRNGKEFNLPEQYDLYFSRFPGICWDGEMLVAENDILGTYLDRKAGNGILNSIRQGKASDEDANRVRFVFWDMVDYDHYMIGASFQEYHSRFESLYTMSLEAPAHFWKVVETQFVSTFEEAQQFYKEKRAEGQEGAILKSMNSTWQAKRVKHHVKMKAEETLDLIVVDWIEGSGKYVGQLGSLVVTDSSGKLVVNVGSGFNDEDRKTITPETIIGKIVEVKYNEVITNKSDDSLSLFLPIFENVREDKNKPDTI